MSPDRADRTRAMLPVPPIHFKGMKLRTRFSALTLGLILMATGCAKPAFNTSTIFDPLAFFPTKATFAWDDQANHLPDNPELQPLEYDRVIKQVANEEFGKRGYTNSATDPTDDADYRLSYELTVHRWISTEKTRAIGTLSLTLVDTKSNNRVWLGFGRAQVFIGLNEEERVERLRGILAEILAGFPPNQRGEE